MRIKVVERFEDFLALEQDWDLLLSKSQSEHVCLTFEWMRCWWEAFGKGNALCVCLAYDSSGALIAIAPLMFTRGVILGVPVRQLTFIYNDNSSRMDFIIAGQREQVIPLFWDYIWSQKDKWDMVFFENICEESPNLVCLKEYLSKKKMLSAVKDGLYSPYIPIDLPWDDYFKLRSKKLRKTLKNIFNRVEKAEYYAFEMVNDVQRSAGALADICEVSSRSWKARMKREIGSSAENKAFFSLLNDQAVKTGWQTIWLLRVNDKPIAYEYTLQYKDKAYLLRADYDEAYGHLSPGSVLSCQMIKHYFEQGIKECDLCGNDDEYKKKWTQTARRHYHISVYSTAIFSRSLYLLAERCVYPFKRALKQVGFLRKIKRSIMDRK